MPVTNGTVSYGRTVKTGDYENKKVEVSLSFNVDDGQDVEAVTQETGLLAVKKAHEFLGIRTTALTTTIAAPKTETSTQTSDTDAAKAAALAANTAKKPPGRPPNPEKVATKAAVELAQLAAAEAEKAKLAEAAKAAALAADGTGKPGVVEDEDIFGAEAPEISDSELTKSASAKCEELKKVHAGAAPAMIRKLIGTFFKEPTGKQLRDVPQPQRAEFLKQLAALK